MSSSHNALAERLAERLKAAPRTTRAYFERIAGILSAEGRCGRVADLGCGTAWLGSRLLDDAICVDYVGVDASANMLRIARRRDPRLRVINGSALHVPMEANSVDTVVLEHAIHWIRDLARLAAQCDRILADGGQVVIVTSDLKTLGALWEYRLFPEALTIDRQRLHSTREIDRGFETAGFARDAAHAIQIGRRKFDDIFLQHVQARKMSSLLMVPQSAIAQLETRVKAVRDELWGTTQDISVLALVYKRDARRSGHA